MKHGSVDWPGPAQWRRPSPNSLAPSVAESAPPPPHERARGPSGSGRLNRSIAMAAATAALFLTGCTGKVDPSSPPTPSTTASNVTLTAAQRPHIRLYTVKSAPFRRTVSTTGTVDFDRDQATTVLSPISGPVTRLLVSLGERVKAGQPLAEVASPDYATAISAYRKAIATAKTAAQIAKRDQQLLQHQGIAQRDAEQAATDAANAVADREAARQALVSLGVDASTLQALKTGQPVSQVQGLVRAPVAGTVVEKLITPGELLQAGSTACFTVADLSHVWVMAQVFGDDLTAVHLGDPATIETGIGSEQCTGAVDNIAALVDPDTRSVAVRVLAQNPNEVLKKRMYVRVLIHARRESTGLLVPVSAILRDDENLPFVYLAQTDGSFARRQVTLGYRAGNQYNISAGLKAGDRIVVEGDLFVQFLQNQ